MIQIKRWLTRNNLESTNRKMEEWKKDSVIELLEEVFERALTDKEKNYVNSWLLAQRIKENVIKKFYGI